MRVGWWVQGRVAQPEDGTPRPSTVGGEIPRIELPTVNSVDKYRESLQQLMPIAMKKSCWKVLLVRPGTKALTTSAMFMYIMNPTW